MSSSSRRSLSSRLRDRARKAAVPAMLLSITIGGVGVSATAHAAEGPSCFSAPAQTCPAPAPAPAPLPPRGDQPAGISNQQWRGAASAAEFWSREGVSNIQGDRFHLVAPGERGYPGQGWPGNITQGARAWYHFDTGTSRVREHHYIYYGGLFRDGRHVIQGLEERHHVTPNNADGSQDIYREYDVHAWNHAQTGIRGRERIVRNTRNGHVYATFDHYGSFHYLGRW
ncbi:ribonuclease domain-containing protein [Streptomyces sp. DG2A-72]|uniref:ribonuclease domain-containing protein n=1 Tax=Streptomyces sp. DG2A-72 TaxID=3051386 RepID=UPI00265C6084|nr:ribonuclease domain-containing protein [Streptomyces sp. DG2A-72]MDO0933902.1 ribonuclease domain-containing protein [Streptomyces sp. DG2A-72]